jgi:hypothetical protein
MTVKFSLPSFGPFSEFSMIDRRWFIALSLGACLTLCGSAQDSTPKPAPPKGQRVFYTGHSFHMFVPKLIEGLVPLAKIEGHKLVGTQSIGGSKVIQHWDRADDMNTAKKALLTGEVDVFTMAPHLMIPDPGIDNFVELGLKHNPNMRFLLQASWYPFDVAPATEGFIRDNAARDQAKIPALQAAVDEWRTKLEGQADALNKKYDKEAVFIIPVGDAIVKLREMVAAEKFPGITKQSQLFRDPIGHGQGHVMALAAYCNYVAIYRASPEGLPLQVDRSVNDEQNAILQKIAWETVSKYPHAGIAKRDAPAQE